MSKYYIKSGTLERIYSCNKCPRDAAMDIIWETTKNDTLDEYIYLDEYEKWYEENKGLKIEQDFE